MALFIDRLDISTAKPSLISWIGYDEFVCIDESGCLDTINLHSGQNYTRTIKNLPINPTSLTSNVRFNATDKQYVCIGGMNGVIIVYSVEQGEIECSFQDESISCVTCLSFDHTGNLIAVAFDNASIKIFTKALSIHKVFNLKTKHGASNLSWSPDNTQLAICYENLIAVYMISGDQSTDEFLEWRLDPKHSTLDMEWSTLSNTITAITVDHLKSWSPEGILLKSIKFNPNYNPFTLHDSTSGEHFITFNSNSAAVIYSKYGRSKYIDIFGAANMVINDCKMSNFDRIALSTVDGRIQLLKFYQFNYTAWNRLIVKMTGINELRILEENSTFDEFAYKEESLITFRSNSKNLIVLTNKKIYVYSVIDADGYRTIPPPAQALQSNPLSYQILVITRDRFALCSLDGYLRIYGSDATCLNHKIDIQRFAQPQQTGLLTKLSTIVLDYYVTVNLERRTEVMFFDIQSGKQINQLTLKFETDIVEIEAEHIKLPSDEALLAILDANSRLYIRSITSVKSNLRKEMYYNLDSQLLVEYSDSIKALGFGYTSIRWNESISVLAACKYDGISIFVWPRGSLIQAGYEVDEFNSFDINLNSDEFKSQRESKHQDTIECFYDSILCLSDKSKQNYKHEIDKNVLELHQAFEANQLKLFEESWRTYIFSGTSSGLDTKKSFKLAIWNALASMVLDGRAGGKSGVDSAKEALAEINYVELVEDML